MLLNSPSLTTGRRRTKNSSLRFSLRAQRVHTIVEETSNYITFFFFLPLFSPSVLKCGSQFFRFFFQSARRFAIARARAPDFSLTSAPRRNPFIVLPNLFRRDEKKKTPNNIIRTQVPVYVTGARVFRLNPTKTRPHDPPRYTRIYTSCTTYI